MSTSKAGILTVNTTQVEQTSGKHDRDARYSIRAAKHLLGRPSSNPMAQSAARTSK